MVAALPRANASAIPAGPAAPAPVTSLVTEIGNTAPPVNTAPPPADDPVKALLRDKGDPDPTR